MASKTRASILDQLARVHPDLTGPQRQVADYILKHPDKVRDATVIDICEATGSSEPVLFAVCRAAGCKGYKQLKIDLAGELAVRQARRSTTRSLLEESAPDVELNGNETPQQLARKIGAVYLESVESAIEQLDGKAFARAVKLLSRAGKAVIYGMGTSGHVARIGEYALLRAGVTVNCSTDSFVQLAYVAALGKGDVAMAISYMGEHAETTEALSLARKRGASTIALTCRTDSALARAADVVLELPPRRRLESYVSIGARIAAAELYVIDALAAAVALANRKTFDERARAIKEVVEERKGRRTRRRKQGGT